MTEKLYTSDEGPLQSKTLFSQLFGIILWHTVQLHLLDVTSSTYQVVTVAV